MDVLKEMALDAKVRGFWDVSVLSWEHFLGYVLVFILFFLS